MIVMRAVGKLGSVAALVAALAEQVTGQATRPGRRGGLMGDETRISTLEQVRMLERLRRSNVAAGEEAEARDCPESARWYAGVVEDISALIAKIESAAQEVAHGSAR